MCDPQPFATYKAWMNELVGYLGSYKQLLNVPVSPDRPGVQRALRLLWMSAPSVFATRRNMYLSTVRVRQFTEYSAGVMRGLGVPVIDFALMTQSRWDACSDGLHYCISISTDYLSGQVATGEFQLALNVIFPECSG